METVEDIKPDTKYLPLFTTIKDEPISELHYDDGLSTSNSNNEEVSSLGFIDNDVKDREPLDFIDVKTELKSTDEPISGPEYTNEHSDITNASNTEQEEDRDVKSVDDVVKDEKLFNFTGPDVVKREPVSTDEDECSSRQQDTNVQKNAGEY